MKTRETDIGHLLRHNLTRIEELKNKNNLIKMQIEVKAILQDYVSVLEYIAMDLNSAGPRKPEKRIYFPIYDKEEAFKNSAKGSWVGAMETMNVDIYNLILSIQPFITKSNVLSDLSTFNNINKHQKLLEVEQNLHRGQQVTVGNNAFVMGGKGSRMTNCSVDGMRVPDVIFDDKGVPQIGKNGDPRVSIAVTIMSREIISIGGHNRDMFKYFFSVDKILGPFSKKAYELLQLWEESKKTTGG